jgi:UDP-N-acetyl-D-glucosamine dehydrogenase
MAYKADVSDSRESPAIDIALLLERSGAIVSYSDPFVPTIQIGTSMLTAMAADQALSQGIDCAVITTNHRAFDYRAIVEQAPLVVDTRNALKSFTGEHIVRL